MQMCPRPFPRATEGPCPGGQPVHQCPHGWGWEEAAAGAAHSHVQGLRPRDPTPAQFPQESKAQPRGLGSLEGCPAGSPSFAETPIAGLAAPSAGPGEPLLLSACSRACFTQSLNLCFQHQRLILQGATQVQPWRDHL